MAVDWTAIKTEYITTDTSYRKLAQKYNIHYKVISEKGKDEEWVALRSQHRDKTLTKTLDRICEDKVDRATRLQSAADKLLEIVEAHLREDPKKITSQSLKQISGVLKDIKDVQRTSKDLEEQDARIASLRKQAEKGETGNEVVVEITGEAVELSG